jgi:biopolymer transport protein TolQ
MNPVTPPPASALSIYDLFMHADIIVKGVIIGLLICSVWVWAIVFDKTILYARMRRSMDRFEQAFWSGQSLE